MNKEKIILFIWGDKKIDDYCKSVKGSDWEELKSELIIQLYNMTEKKLQEALEGGFLEYLCFKIIKRIVYGNIKSSGIFYKKNSIILGVELNNHPDQSKAYEEDRERKVWEMVGREHYYGRTLFNEYYKEGLTLKEISMKYGINLKSIHYTINKLRIKIKNNINGEK